MSSNLNSVEKRWRAIALNQKAPRKLRLAALTKMLVPSPWFLNQLADDPDVHVQYAANERLAAIQQFNFNKKQLAHKRK
jgi:hypothetical protein